MTTKIMEMYEQIAPVITQRYEMVEAGDSLVLRTQRAPLTIELSEHEGVGALFQANLTAPLEGMQDPQEGIETLTALQNRRDKLRWNGYEGTFHHYDEGFEVRYKFGVDRDRLQRALRDFSFPDYRFQLEVDLEHYFDPKAKRLTGYIIEVDGKKIRFGEEIKAFGDLVRTYVNSSLEENPLMRIGHCGISNGLVTYIELESEDEEILHKTQGGLCKILNELQERTDLELIVTRKVMNR